MNMLMISSLVSWMVAGIAAYVAWRTMAESRRQSALRVAALAADLQVDDPEPISFVQESTRVATSLFETPPAESDRRGRVALVAGALVVGTVLCLVIGLSALGHSTATENTRVAPQGVPMPVDLMALTHERAANTVTVRGIVRNPLSGREISHLTAVVMLYSSQGSVVASGQGPIAETVLAPGAESTFAVTLPDQSALGRYRVSFKTDERVISHVDRRMMNQDR